MTALLGAAGIAAAPQATAVAPSTAASSPGGTLPANPYPAGQFLGEIGAKVLGRLTATGSGATITLPTALFHGFTASTVTPPQFIEDVNLFVVSPAGSASKYGVFAPTRTTVLVAGKIPVSATVQLTQASINGVLKPFTLHATSNLDTNVSTPAKLAGRVQVQVSDVTIAGIPVPVGSNCHTTGPATLYATGHTASYNVGTGGFLTGNVSVPAFTGCKVGPLDISPVISLALSGPKNPVTLSQGGIGVWTDPAGCDGCTEPTPVP